MTHGCQIGCGENMVNLGGRGKYFVDEERMNGGKKGGIRKAIGVGIAIDRL